MATEEQLRAEMQGAWDAFTAHNREFMARTPMGEPGYTQWKQKGRPIAERVLDAIAEMHRAGLEFTVPDGPPTLEAIRRDVILFSRMIAV